MFTLVFAAIAVVGFVVHALVSQRPTPPERLLELFLRWFIGVGLGVVGVFAFLGHTFEARQVAEQIGFPPGNPFQWEVAWANLGLGIVALTSVWRRDFRWPTAIFAAIYLWGAAWGHIYQLVVHGNHHIDNAGPVLYGDLLFPLVVIFVLLAQRSLAARMSEPAPAAQEAGVLSASP
jgi:uncharacterized membrane protein YphA (DoxX/SURF4 family)